MITKKGTVVTKPGDKTIKVEVHTYKAHPKYKKQYRVTRRFMVHDEDNSAQVGDTVSIVQSRPVSKRKSWALVTEDAS